MEAKEPKTPPMSNPECFDCPLLLESAAHLSHEVRTPLTGILGIVDMLVDSDINEQQKSYLNAIKHTTESLVHMLGYILDLTRPPSGQKPRLVIPFDVRALVHNTSLLMEPLGSKKAIQIETKVDREIPDLVCGDRHRIQQVLFNLLSNALKNTDRGIVRLSARLLTPTDPERLDLVFEVEDEGRGIPAAQLPHVFNAAGAPSRANPFHEGSGIGLGLCKKIVEFLGGSIHAASTLGKGSRFWFQVPFEKASSAHNPAPAPRKTTLRGPEFQGKALIVEDNLVNQIVSRRNLEKLGLQVVASAHGEEALKALETDDFDLIFMDCQMPQMDGYEASRRIRAGQIPRARNIPIIALTAHAMTGDRDRCLQAGMNDYIPKPVSQSDLRKMIRKWLNADKQIQSTGEIIDLTSYSVLKDMEMKEDPQLLRELMTSFIETNRIRIDRLQTSMNPVNRKGLISLAHELVPGCLLLGALPLAESCRDMEQNAEHWSDDVVIARAEKLKEHCITACNFFESELGRAPFNDLPKASSEPNLA